MPIELPESAQEVEARSKADVQRELATSNPFGKNSWLGAIVTGAANRIYDFYLQLRVAIRDNFPDTAIGSALTRWAAIFGINLLAASKSSGKVVATGTAGSIIPAATTLAASGVGNFVTTDAATISAQTINITSLTRSGTTVTATTSSAHNLASGVPVTVAGATDSAFDVTASSITVTGLDEFQYEIVGSPSDEPATPATASFTTASVPIQSEDFGAAVNLDAGTELTLQSPIVGVDDTLTVDYGEIGGGTDQETEDALRGRTLDRIQNPVAMFNVAAITEAARSIAGVTRVFVQEITPAVGQVTVYFMRDNDTNPIPAASEVSLVEAAILELKPANTDDDDVIVAAPVAVPVDFTFSSLSPNTTSMRDALEANLQQLFDERTDVGVDVTEDAYRSAIFNTVDTVTGAVVASFALSAPVGDVTVTTGEIGTLGTVSFS